MRQWMILTVALVALCAAFFLRSGKKSVEQTNLAPFEQLGQVLAQETLQAVPGAGRVVVVRYRLTAPLQNPVLEAAADTFLRAIRKDGRLQIASVIEDTYNPLEREAGWANTRMESSRFVELLAEHADVDAVVLIGGTPALAEKDANRLSSPHPKILAAAVLTPPAEWLLAKGILTAAIVSRSTAAQEREVPRTPQEWFDRRYEVLRSTKGGTP